MLSNIQRTAGWAGPAGWPGRAGKPMARTMSMEAMSTKLKNHWGCRSRILRLWTRSTLINPKNSAMAAMRTAMLIKTAVGR